MKAEEFFTSAHQVKRYDYAIKLAKILKQYQDQGYLIFQNDEIVTGIIEWETDFSSGGGRFDTTWSIVSITEENCRFGLVDLEYYEDCRPWIPTLKTIKKTFKEFKVVHPNNLESIV